MEYESFEANDKAYFYHACYSFYLDVDKKWHDVEEVCYGREGKVIESYSLN